MPKSLTADHNELWKILSWVYQTTWPDSWEISTQVKKQVRTGHGTVDWFQIGKGVHQGCILSPCLFNLYAEYIMRNAGLEEAQAGIRLLGEIPITSDMQATILMAESEEELKSLLMKVKEWKSWLKTQHSKTKIMAIGPITSQQTHGETSGWLYSFGLQNHCRWWLQPWN